MLTDQQAQRIAAQWHGGGGSALYQFASTGAIDPRSVERELNQCHSDDPMEVRQFTWLIQYARRNGPRPAQPNWYQRVICAKEN